MNPKVLKPEVKRLYLDGKSVEDICELILGAKSSTIYNWINKEKWGDIRDKKLNAYTNTGEILLMNLEKMIETLGDKISDPTAMARTADSINKIVNSIKKLAKEKDRLSSIIFTVGELVKYMSENSSAIGYDDTDREKLSKLLAGFQSYSIERYSPKNLNP